jgi:O-antigen/teichoic acid export membrane protein
MSQSANAHPEIGRQLIHGSAWMIAMRFSIRGLGLISTIVLARLLTPSDFGVVAMAMIFIGFIEVFNETGQQLALIAHHKPERAHYDSAWTVTVLIAFCLTAVVLLSAPYATLYFHDARIVPVIELLSLRIFFGGFLNIGVIDFRRDLDFAREFKFGVYRKLVTFMTTLTLAVLWRDYWALAVGTVVGSLMELSLSYLMHSYRPRFCIAKVGEIWSYSFWILLQSIGRYFEARLDQVVAAGVVPAGAMGHYTISAELGSLPMTELVEPVSRALFPNYARIASNPALLRNVYLKVFSAAAVVCISTSVGLILVAKDFVAVVLGPQWTSSAYLLCWFAAAGAITGISNTVFAVFNAVGGTRLSATQTWLRVGAYVPVTAWAAYTGTLANFVIARFAVSVILAPTFFLQLRRIIPVTWGQLAGSLWRPLTASVAMWAWLTFVDFPTLVGNVSLRLGMEVITGAAVFLCTQLAVWKLAGAPAGIEAVVWHFCGFGRATQSVRLTSDYRKIG